MRLRIRSERSHAERLAEGLEELGAVAISFEDAGDVPRFELAPDEGAPLWPTVVLEGLFPEDADADALVKQLSERAGAQDLPVERDRVEDQDWERTWLTHFKPLHVGRNLWVVPTWFAPPDPQAVNVFIDPGLAFGTGTHATTRLCLEWLADHLPDSDAQTVIDYGCGSGILAIAALKLGAVSAIGVDIDIRALAASEENATRNGVGDRFTAGDVDAALPPADLVIANILAEPLIGLAPRLQALVRPGGRLLLSGLMVEQVDEVAAAYREFSCERRERDGWALLVGARRAS